MNIAFILNLLTILFAAMGFSITLKESGLKAFIYYTEISNLLALCSSLFYLFFPNESAPLRLSALCMLGMTFMISLFVLSKAVGSIKAMMVDGNGIYHHTLVPIITFISYVFFEKHSSAWYFPVGVSMVYGIVMYVLNYLRKIDGPYPFFQVHRLGLKASVLWFFALIAFISSITFVILFLTVH